MCCTPSRWNLLLQLLNPYHIVSVVTALHDATQLDVACHFFCVMCTPWTIFISKDYMSGGGRATAGVRRQENERTRAGERAIGRRRASDDGGPTADARATVAARDRRRDQRRDRLGERAATGESNSSTVQQRYSCAAIAPFTNQQPTYPPCVYNSTEVHTTETERTRDRNLKSQQQHSCMYSDSTIHLPITHPPTIGVLWHSSTQHRCAAEAKRSRDGM